MARIIRLDIINGNPRTFVAPQDLEQGMFLEIVGKAPNVDLGVEADYEAYEVQLAGTNTKRGQLMLHASVANQYDERLMEADFVLKEGKIGRGYQPIMGDIVTIAKDLIAEEVAEGDELALGADGMLAKGTGLAVVEAIEEINIPGGEPQASVVIRFL